MHNLNKENQIASSAVWAAYGDALGFITELADTQRMVYLRSGYQTIDKTIPWKRRIGGMSGASVNLPAGAYSDDTQLRLSTCRCVRSDGRFDVDTFAKIELPVWSNYALGAGRGTKVAVSNLASKDVSWFSNFFKKGDIDYFQGGGNGAAMRIQPHVWACHALENKAYLLDVFKNSITTHGHARGFLGAVFHAESLAYTLQHGKLPGPNEWLSFFDTFRLIPNLIKDDYSLSTFWLPVWEDKSGISIKDAIEAVINECSEDYDRIVPLLRGTSQNNFHECLEIIGGLDPATRGSGTKTALIASVHAWLCNQDSPEGSFSELVNILRSDTDTIATMSGALVGAKGISFPNATIQDQEYIEDQAIRLHKVSQSEPVSNFEYPDLLSWSPPKTLISTVTESERKPQILGLGEAISISSKYHSKGKNASAWMWVQSSFGQTMLVKVRPELEFTVYQPLPFMRQNKSEQVTTESGDYHVRRSFSETKRIDTVRAEQQNDSRVRNRFTSPALREKKQKDYSDLSMDELSDLVFMRNFDDKLIGECIVELSGRTNGIELAATFAGIIAKAIVNRKKKKVGLETLL